MQAVYSTPILKKLKAAIEEATKANLTIEYFTLSLEEWTMFVKEMRLARGVNFTNVHEGDFAEFMKVKILRPQISISKSANKYFHGLWELY